MVRNVYGKTAWGKAFLDALGAFDINKRLGRGKTYANTGKVLSINIQKSLVQARVQGSFAPFYNVGIQFSKMPDSAVLFDIVGKNPMLLAHVLNNELPSELLTKLQERRVQLLPRSWSEMKGSCTCPDQPGPGNPCKHLAAVYHIITTEIDQNPFTLFQLRGVDLAKQFSIKQSATEVPYPLPVQLTQGAAGASTSSEEVPPEVAAAQPVKLLKIASNANFVLGCLANNPPFSLSLNYKDVMTEFYAHVGKKHKAVMQLTEPWWAAAQEGPAKDRLQRVVSHSSFCLQLQKNFAKPRLLLTNQLFGAEADPAEVFCGMPFERVAADTIAVDVLPFFKVLLQLPSDVGSLSYRFFFYAARVTYLLLSTCSFTPAVLPLDERRFRIVFKPLVSSAAVAEQLESLAAAYPANDPCVILDENGPLAAESGTLHCVTAALTRSVAKLDFMHKKFKDNPPKESLAFWRQQDFHVMALSEASTAAAIAKYFGLFDLLKFDIHVEIRVLKSETEAPDPATGISLYTLGLWMRRKDTEGEHAPLHTFFQQNPDKKEQVLKFLSSLAPYLGGIEKLLMEESIPLRGSTFETFIIDTALLLANLGISVALPRELKKIIRPRAVVRASSQDGDASNKSHQSYLMLPQLLKYDWQIAVGDMVITVADFQRMVSEGRKIIRYKDEYVALSSEEIKAMLEQVAKPVPRLSSSDLLKASLSSDQAVWLDADVEQLLAGMTRSKEFPLPQGLQAQLREYQHKGFCWLTSILSHGFGGILADDMGLGKTIQTIAVLLHLKEGGQLSSPALLVVPTSLISNWEKEIARFGPSLRVTTFYSGNRKLQKIDTNTGALQAARAAGPDRAKKAREETAADVILTSYQCMRIDVEALRKQRLSCLVIDEAQNIKNNKAATTKALKSIKPLLHLLLGSPYLHLEPFVSKCFWTAGFRIALSGTPVENNLSELHSIFDYVMPGYLGTPKDFAADFSKDIEIRRDEEKLAKLKAVTAPFMLRRLKSDRSIIKDLPDKIVSDTFATLSKTQAALYEGVVQEILEKMATMEPAAKRGLIFKLLTSLKQICNHPANYNASAAMVPDESGKATLLNTLLETIIEKGEKVLIFTQYVRMAHLLSGMIKTTHLVQPLLPEGSMSKADRDKAVHKFQTDPSAQVFILSLKAGGVGLNLTAGNHVVHYDLWWNPAVEAQATDRAFRIGQQTNVFVYRFITTGTFEEKINEMMSKKRELSDLSMSTGESWIADMSDEELRQLFARHE